MHPILLIILGVAGALALFVAALVILALRQPAAPLRREVEGEPEPMALPTPSRHRLARPPLAALDTLKEALGFEETATSALSREDEDGTSWTVRPAVLTREPWQLIARRAVRVDDLTLSIFDRHERGKAVGQSLLVPPSLIAAHLSAEGGYIALARWTARGGQAAIAALDAWRAEGLIPTHISPVEVVLLINPIAGMGDRVKRAMALTRDWFGTVEANAKTPLDQQLLELLERHPTLARQTLTALRDASLREDVIAALLKHLKARGEPPLLCAVALVFPEALSRAARIKALSWGLSQGDALANPCADTLIRDYPHDDDALAALLPFAGITPLGWRAHALEPIPRRASWLPRLIALAPDGAVAARVREHLVRGAMRRALPPEERAPLRDALDVLLRRPGERERLLALMDDDAATTEAREAAALAALLWFGDQSRVAEAWSGALSASQRAAIVWAMAHERTPALMRQPELLLAVAAGEPAARADLLDALLDARLAVDQAATLALESVVRAPSDARLERLVMSHSLLDRPDALPAALALLERSVNTRTRQRVLVTLAGHPDADAEALAAVLAHPELPLSALRKVLERRGDPQQREGLLDALRRSSPTLPLTSLEDAMYRLRAAPDAPAREVLTVMLQHLHKHPARAAVAREVAQLPWLAEVSGLDWLVEAIFEDDALDDLRVVAARWAAERGELPSLRALVQAERWRHPARDEAIEALRARVKLDAGALSLAEGDHAGALSLSAQGERGALALSDEGVS